MMKLERFKPPEPDDPMCCCECDTDQYACCDCEGLDEACTRWLKGKHQNPASQLPVFGGVMDRLRKHLLSGDRQVEISTLPALVLLPLLLRVAALHFLLGIVILTALPGLVLWYYYVTHRKKRRTLFFLTMALYSLAYMYYLFLTEILPRGDVSHFQLFTVTTGVVLTIVSLVHTKRGPGFVKPWDSNMHSPINKNCLVANYNSSHCKEADQLVVSAISLSAIEQQTENRIVKWGRCPVCKLMRPPRAGHCRICGGCVKRLDHHCVWINSCVGQANHRSFLLTLLVFLLTSLYGISLVLRSVCPQQYLMTALLYCPGVYNCYSSALCFTCAWYSSIVTGGLIHILVLQVINISYNVTEREAQLALRKKSVQSPMYIIDSQVYSRGFYQNWLEFLTMANTPVKQFSKNNDLVKSPI